MLISTAESSRIIVVSNNVTTRCWALVLFPLLGASVTCSKRSGSIFVHAGNESSSYLWLVADSSLLRKCVCSKQAFSRPNSIRSEYNDAQEQFRTPVPPVLTLSIGRGQLRPLHGTLQNADLMTKREDLQLQCGTAPEDAKTEAKGPPRISGSEEIAGRRTNPNLSSRSECSGTTTSAGAQETETPSYPCEDPGAFVVVSN
jgi:hypothetical protein